MYLQLYYYLPDSTVDTAVALLLFVLESTAVHIGGGSGAQGVARVVAHGLPAVRRAAVARLHEPTTRGNKENGCKMEAEDAARGSIFGFSPQSEVSRVC